MVVIRDLIINSIFMGRRVLIEDGNNDRREVR